MRITIDCPFMDTKPHSDGNHEQVGFLDENVTVRELNMFGVWVTCDCDEERGGCGETTVAHIRIDKTSQRLRVRHYKLEDF